MSKWKRNIDEPFKPEPVSDLARATDEQRMNASDDLARTLTAETLANLAIKLEMIGGGHDDFMIAVMLILRNMAVVSMASLYEKRKLTQGHALAMAHVGEIIKEEAQSYGNKSKTKA